MTSRSACTDWRRKSLKRKATVKRRCYRRGFGRTPLALAGADDQPSPAAVEHRIERPTASANLSRPSCGSPVEAAGLPVRERRPAVSRLTERRCQCRRPHDPAAEHEPVAVLDDAHTTMHTGILCAGSGVSALRQLAEPRRKRRDAVPPEAQPSRRVRLAVKALCLAPVSNCRACGPTRKMNTNLMA